jgi:hypothetical protein
MRVVGPISEPEVVATFLRGELDSARWGEALRALLREAGEDERVVSRPNVADARENAFSERLLDQHRGWVRRDGLFGGLPERIDWSRVALGPAEVLSILYINWDWWLRVSGGTRLPLDTAARIRANEIPGSTAEEHEPIAARLRTAEAQPELIVVAPPDRSRLVLMEGHVRLTAYALYPEYLPEELEVVLGTSTEIARWCQF